MKTDLTEEQVNRYLAGGGLACPVCSSLDIESGPVDIDAKFAWAEVECLKCKSRWQDVYRLDGVNGVA